MQKNTTLANSSTNAWLVRCARLANSNQGSNTQVHTQKCNGF